MYVEQSPFLTAVLSSWCRLYCAPYESFITRLSLHPTCDRPDAKWKFWGRNHEARYLTGSSSVVLSDLALRSLIIRRPGSLIFPGLLRRVWVTRPCFMKHVAENGKRRENLAPKPHPQFKLSTGFV